MLEALAHAAARLAGRDPAAHFFLESRLERRLDISADGRVAATAAHVQGLAAETSPGSGVFRTVGRLEDVDLIAAAAARGEYETHTQDAQRAPVPESHDASELLDALGALARSVSGVVQFVEVDQRVAVARRDGEKGFDRRRGRRVSIRTGGVVEERVFSGRDMDLRGLAERVTERVAVRRDALPPFPGRTPVVFAPGVGGVLLHEMIGHALEADALVRRSSMLTQLEGPVAPRTVTVLDDPRRGRVPWNMDDEGTQARAVSLIEGGRVSGRLTSWGWPGSPPHPPSGHARRASFAEPVLPRMGATFLAPGTLHPHEVLEGIARGLYVRRMAAAWAEPERGRATFHVTDADQVIAGRIDRPLEPFLFEVQVEDLLLLDCIASDLAFDTSIGVCVREGQALASTVGAPTFRLGLVTVMG